MSDRGALYAGLKHAFVRAYDRRALLKLKGSAATGVVREVLESAIVMARRAMDAVGVDAQEIDRTEDLYRRRDRERLRIQHEAGDIRAARDVIIGNPELDWRAGREKPVPLEPKSSSETDCG